MTSCPDCSGSDLQSLGIETGERLDDSHTVLISGFRCRSCGCEFSEVQVTSWRTEVTRRGSMERLILAEWSR
jgi:transposase-like protein